jgi:hypothetical protein
MALGRHSPETLDPNRATLVPVTHTDFWSSQSSLETSRGLWEGYREPVPRLQTQTLRPPLEGVRASTVDQTSHPTDLKHLALTQASRGGRGPHCSDPNRVWLPSTLSRSLSRQPICREAFGERLQAQMSALAELSEKMCSMELACPMRISLATPG